MKKNHLFIFILLSSALARGMNAMESKEVGETACISSDLLTEDQLRFLITSQKGSKADKRISWYDLAARLGYVRIFEFFAGEYDPKKKTKEGYTLFLIACAFDHPEVAMALLADSDLYAQTNSGDDALKLILHNDSQHVFPELLKHWDFNLHGSPEYFIFAIKNRQLNMAQAILEKIGNLKPIYKAFAENSRVSRLICKGGSPLALGLASLAMALKSRDENIEWSTFSARGELIELPTLWLSRSSHIRQFLEEHGDGVIIITHPVTISILIIYALSEDCDFEKLFALYPSSSPLRELKSNRLMVPWAAWYLLCHKKFKTKTDEEQEARRIINRFKIIKDYDCKGNFLEIAAALKELGDEFFYKDEEKGE